jgi:hypothetical protein
LKLAVKFDCVDKLIFLGFVYYSDLPLFTESCHIGLACYSNVGIMNQTIATASNKIYEYCALKLPVLSNCNELSNNYWSTYVWCKLVNFVDDELLDAIEFIDNNYEYLSMEAYKDFLGGLNFQHNFKYIKLNHIE